MVEKRYNTVPLPMGSPAWKETQVDFFIILAISYNHLSWFQTHANILFQQNGKFQQFLETVYPGKRTISIQAPQYRQHALISDFLDLAILRIRGEALLATNWIKDRFEGLKIQNLPLATMTGQAMSSFPKI